MNPTMLASELSEMGLANEQFFKWLQTDGQRLFGELSGARLLEVVRTAGYEIRTQSFYDLRREILGITKFEEQISRLSEISKIPASFINDDHGLNLSNNFLYRFHTRYIDVSSNEWKESFASFLSSERLSPEEARKLLAEQISFTPQEEGSPYVIEYEVGKLQTVLSKPDLFD